MDRWQERRRSPDPPAAVRLGARGPPVSGASSLAVRSDTVRVTCRLPSTEARLERSSVKSTRPAGTAAAGKEARSLGATDFSCLSKKGWSETTSWRV